MISSTMKGKTIIIVDEYIINFCLCQGLGGDLLDQNAKAARAAYQREWRRKNPDKVREINNRYWLRRAEKELIRRAAEKEEGTEQ